MERAHTVDPMITEALPRLIIQETDPLLSRLIEGRLEVPMGDLLLRMAGLTDRLRPVFESFLRRETFILPTSTIWTTLLLFPPFSVTLERFTSSLRKSTR
jgi:hypothetical protein